MAKGRTLRDMVDSGTVSPPSTQMSKEDKEAMAASGDEFTITSCAIGEGAEFGGYWEVGILHGDRERTFQLSMHPKREAFMSDLAVAVGEGPIDGCRLVNKGGSKGSPFLVIEPADAE